MNQIDLNQISKIVKTEIQAELLNKQTKYKSISQKNKQHQIALFELKVLRKVFEYIEGNPQLESFAQLQTKVQLLESNIIQLNQHIEKLNLTINTLQTSIESKSILIDKQQKQLQILNKKSNQFDKVGGKIAYQKQNTQINSLKQQLQKTKEKNSEYRQSIVQLQSKIQIHKKTNRSQQLQIAQLFVKLSQNQKQNKDTSNRYSTGSNSNNSLYTTIKTPNTQRKSQTSYDRVQLLNLKQKNIDMNRENQRLKQQIRYMNQQWSQREQEYAETIKAMSKKSLLTKFI